MLTERIPDELVIMMHDNYSSDSRCIGHLRFPSFRIDSLLTIQTEEIFWSSAGVTPAPLTYLPPITDFSATTVLPLRLPTYLPTYLLLHAVRLATAK